MSDSTSDVSNTQQNVVTSMYPYAGQKIFQNIPGLLSSTTSNSRKTLWFHNQQLHLYQQDHLYSLLEKHN